MKLSKLTDGRPSSHKEKVMAAEHHATVNTFVRSRALILGPRFWSFNDNLKVLIVCDCISTRFHAPKMFAEDDLL